MSKPSKQQVASAIASLIEENIEQRRIVRDVAAYLTEEGRTNELSAILREVEKLRASKGLREATIISAFELSSQTVSQIEKLLSDYFPKTERFVINYRKDPSIIGGALIETGDVQLDVTLSGRLNKALTINKG